jgi:general secretion pathway protein C
MTARLLAFVVWAAVAATAVFWGLRLLSRAPAAPPHTTAAADAGAARGDLTRLFGTDAAPVAPQAAPAPSRFHLVGVVAPRPGSPPRVGVALIAVDNKPARAYRVGAPIDDRLVVQAVQGRTVSLGPRGAPAEVQLELPPPPAPATGTLPSATEARSGTEVLRPPSEGRVPAQRPPQRQPAANPDSEALQQEPPQEPPPDAAAAPR